MADLLDQTPEQCNTAWGLSINLGIWIEQHGPPPASPPPEIMMIPLPHPVSIPYTPQSLTAPNGNA